MKTINDLISTEVMGGWPIYKMNLREILLALGLENDGTYLKIHANDPILDIYPQKLTDDGMGYGTDEQWICDIDVNKEDNYINVWAEKELPKERLDQLKKDSLELEQIFKVKITEIINERNNK